MVIYSAGEGQQALDRLSDGDPVKNGLFTRVFMKEMERPGVPIDQVARQVRAEVNRQALTVKHEQVPAIYDQVIGQFYFYAQNDADVDEVELVFWTSIKDSSDPAELKAYLDKYPDGQFSGLAQARIKRLEQGQAIPESNPVADVAKPTARAEAPAPVADAIAPVAEPVATQEIAPAAPVPAPVAEKAAGVPEQTPAPVEEAKAPAEEAAAKPAAEAVPPPTSPVVEPPAVVPEPAPAPAAAPEVKAPDAEATANPVHEKQQIPPEPIAGEHTTLTEITPATNTRTQGATQLEAAPAQVVPAPAEQPTAK